ncbi:MULTISPECIES: glutamate decarboxylase [Streptomyces]|uniref:glutamate decarboxylase n=1 Tax=Streptomyces TaxID=1883 RepID=UPI000F7AB3BE|nr:MULTISPECIES: glutamate decarboxylase [Streptomyces]RST07685.1 glutamate decarboxylase [Streptomyces sp. WAC07149]GLX17243.1 glutamate decarboxylase [Streptomyces lavendulae subsp. lavendulae]GLX24898.1 glutamate decarboxylase [Streptomyces lavendulae subsp. lavendulae]
MALHQTKDTHARDDGTDVFASALSGQVLPKYRIPDDHSPAEVVYSLLHNELLLDGNAAQNLATFCTTWSDDAVHRLMNECLDKNMIDKDEYPQTAEIEARCVNILADLWNAPPGHVGTGCSTTGSSEAAMLGGLALKWRWRERRRAEGKPADRPNLVCGPVQICWEKFARYFDVELRQVPLEPGATGLRPHQLAGYVDENTIGVVAILGVTYTCDYEPVAEIAAALDRIQAEHGWDVPVHVDAASGGFVAPFLHPDTVWDFRLPRVASVNTSGHKYGLAPLGVGWIVWRTADLLPAQLVFDVDYLGGDMPTFALNFSRPGGEVIAQYYLFLRLGRGGYRRVQQACADTARYLAAEIEGMGPFTLLYDGQGALPAVSYTLTDPAGAGFTLYDLSDRLRMRGWQVPSYPLPADRQDTVVQRVLIRHGVTRDQTALLVDDLRRAVEHLTATPQPVPATAPRSGFHH